MLPDQSQTDTLRRPLVHVIVASTRPNCAGRTVAAWIVDVARKHSGLEVQLLDLAEIDLPLMDEPAHPVLQEYAHEHTKRWSATIALGDAFVIVTPEYNHSFPASLKNALDYLNREWAYKPVGLVSYGGVSAGLRSATALKPVLLALRMVPVLDAVSIPFVATMIDDGVLVPNKVMAGAAVAMLDELVRVEAAVRGLRNA